MMQIVLAFIYSSPTSFTILATSLILFCSTYEVGVCTSEDCNKFEGKRFVLRVGLFFRR